jgi:hypothetical protein
MTAHHPRSRWDNEVQQGLADTPANIKRLVEQDHVAGWIASAPPH